MQGEQQLIDDILQTAKSSAEATVNEAAAEQNEAMSALQAELDERTAELNAQADKAAEAVKAGKVKLGELEASKILLSAKQTCVSAVYDEVYGKLVSLPKTKYLALMQKLIADVCEDGDEVIVPKGDKRITAAWVKKVATASKKKLTLSKQAGDFAAGVVLRNGKFDRSLTAEDIVAELKERTVSEVVARLGL